MAIYWRGMVLNCCNFFFQRFEGFGVPFQDRWTYTDVVSWYIRQWQHSDHLFYATWPSVRFLLLPPKKAGQSLRSYVMLDPQSKINNWSLMLIWVILKKINVLITNPMNNFPDCTMNDLLINSMFNSVYKLLSLVCQCPWISNVLTNHLESYWILASRRYTYYM